MKRNIIQEKTYPFALRIIEVYKFLIDEKKEYVLAKQLLKSGTSIGANIEEAIGGQSKKDFASKMAIAYKEARETRYWLNLLHDAEYIKSDVVLSLLSEVEEICRIIGKIQIFRYFLTRVIHI